MTKKIVCLLLLFISMTQAQEKKYQSLLWEVSGNGLEKKSYIYGSMHVSEKISYHLSDAFFKHLMEADMIANESDPKTWSELSDVFGGGGYNYGYGAFYTNFYIKELKKDDLYTMFRGTNYNLIGLLSRTNEMNKDYQEDTYLDMFIYRTGRKYGKKTLGLEDVKTSTINIMKGEAKIDRKDIVENRQKLKKLLKNKNYNEAMMDYYREKDLDMLDSLSILSSSKSYLKAMLFDRNIVMVNSMDSIMKTGSLFSAIGAAHLPGERGVIEELRRRGYTVTPVFGDYTEVGKNKKKEIEEYFIKPEFETKTTNDGMISIPMYKIVLDNGKNFESPDLANGGYINVKRSPLKDFIKKDNQIFNHKTLDSLFYENIPGDILDKKFYKEENYLVYDIKSKTKTNNAQRYRYYITPLEIIAVIMGGEGEYVRKYEDNVFNNIKLKPYTDGKEKFIPKVGGFTVDVPKYYVNVGNKDISKQHTDIEIYAYDDTEKANYFLIENTLGDNENLEDSGFEIKRIHYEFYNQIDADSTNTSFDKENLRFTSQSKVGEKEIRLLTSMKGSRYYILGTIGASEEKTKDYFNSFKITPAFAEVETRIYKDSAAMFSIEIPKKHNEYLDFRFERDYYGYEKKKNHFTSKSKAFSFISPTGKDVELSFYQYHKYESEKNMDSIWSDFRKHIKSDFETNRYDDFGYDMDYDAMEEVVEVVEEVSVTTNENGEAVQNKKKKSYNVSRWDEELGFDQKEKNKIEIINEKISTNEDKSIHEYNAIAIKPNSSQAVKYKAVFKDGTSYLLKTLVDKDYKGDNAFIEKTFNSFKPYDTVFSTSIFENKFKYFEEDARSEHDSIRYSALKSIYFLNIEKEELPAAKKFLEEFEFKQDEMESQVTLYEKIGRIKDPAIIPYLESVYKKEDVTTSIQFAVLNALTSQKTKEAYKVILKLLEYDLPLSDNEYEISSLFNSFEFDIENSEVLFPDIFQFYSVNEYHTPIIEYTNKLIESNSGNPKKLKSFKKMLLTNAKLEYKRLSSWKQKQDMKDNDSYGYYGNNNKYAPTSDLISYLNILYPFKKEKDVAELFTKVDKLDVDNLTLYKARVQLEKNNEVDPKMVEKLLEKNETKYVAYQMLHHTKQTSELAKFSEDSIALHGMYYFDDLEKEKDSITFIKKKSVDFNKKEIQFYFYKIIDIDEDSYNKNAEKIEGIAFVVENGRINPQAFKSLRSISFIEEKEIEEFIKASIDECINTNHPRVTHRKIKDNGYDYYGDDMYYED